MPNNTQAPTNTGQDLIWPTIAVVGATDTTRNSVLEFLRGQGLKCWGARSSDWFYRRLFREHTDIVLFDVPSAEPIHLDAITPLQGQYQIGVVVISQQAHDGNEIQAMLAGADYVFNTPFDLQLLLITLNTLWQRIKQQPERYTGSLMNSWQLDETNQQLVIDPSTAVLLSTLEFTFLSTLMAYPGTVVSKQEIYHAVYPDLEQLEPHRLSVLLNRLRLKLKRTHNTLPVRVLYGRGYVFMPQP